MNDLLNNFDLIDPIFILPTFINFILCTFSSIILREIYLKNSLTLSVKNYIGNILPILSITIFLIILIVKSSIALSLGLVGALSIVRFRTPIKDPEELIFFFSIARYRFWIWSNIYYFNNYNFNFYNNLCIKLFIQTKKYSE